jgi:hypothetical protein
VRIPRLAVTSSRLPRSPKPNRRVAFPFEVTRLIYSYPQYKRGICPCPVLSLNRATVRAKQFAASRCAPTSRHGSGYPIKLQYGEFKAPVSRI